MEKENILPSLKKRFVDREVLGVLDDDTLSDEQAGVVYESCVKYFENRPYKLWFNKLDGIIRTLGFSYYDGTLAHFDITPWATRPTWNKLATKEKVLKAGGNIGLFVLENSTADFCSLTVARQLNTCVIIVQT